MRKISFLIAVALLYALSPAVAQAQFLGGSTFTDSDSVVDTQSWTGSSGQAYPFNSIAANLENLAGVIQVLLGSSTACQTITPPSGWTLIPNSVASATGLCQALYFKVFGASESPPYTFSWTGTLPFDMRTYVVSNISVFDVASNASGISTAPAAPTVTTTLAGDYLMAFFAQLGAGTWTAPTGMGIAVVAGDYQLGTGSFTAPTDSVRFLNLTTQAWAYPIGATGTETAAISSSAQWVADLVAFKPLYPILISGIAQPLASFGTFAPSIEGETQTESDSTAACSLGATATSGGTMHCAIRCNGTNWIQMGL